jgi:DnaA family protein
MVRMQQLLDLDLVQPPPPTLDNFAAGSNGQVLAALQSWLGGMSREQCIYLWGPPASGRTHLLLAMAAARAGHSTVVRAGQLAALESGHVPALIAVDDVEQLDEAEQGTLFRLFQRAAETGTLLLVSGGCAPAALSMRDDLRTRLGSGLVFQLHPLSDEEKAQALVTHAAQRRFELTLDIAHYLLRRQQRDLGSLMQILDALDRYSLRTHRPITLPLVRELLQGED